MSEIVYLENGWYVSPYKVGEKYRYRVYDEFDACVLTFCDEDMRRFSEIYTALHTSEGKV